MCPEDILEDGERKDGSPKLKQVRAGGEVAESKAENETGSDLFNRDIVKAAEAQRAEQSRNRNSCRSRLFRAIKAGDADIVREILKSGELDAKVPGMWQNTPLICACQYSQSEIANILLQYDCGIDLENEKGCTAMHYAAVGANYEVIQNLLMAGARVLLPPASLYNEKLDTKESLDPIQAAAAANCARSTSAIVGALLQQCGAPDERLRAAEVVSAALKISCERGHAAVLRPLFRFFYDEESVSHRDENTLSTEFVHTLLLLCESNSTQNGADSILEEFVTDYVDVFDRKDLSNIIMEETEVWSSAKDDIKNAVVTLVGRVDE